MNTHEICKRCGLFDNAVHEDPLHCIEALKAARDSVVKALRKNLMDPWVQFAAAALQGATSTATEARDVNAVREAWYAAQCADKLLAEYQARLPEMQPTRAVHGLMMTLDPYDDANFPDELRRARDRIYQGLKGKP